MATQTAETDRGVSLGDDGLETLAGDTEATILTIDIESNLETAIDFGAQSTPTFVLFADGQPVKQLRGGQTEQTLRDLTAQYND